jgi:uncharacterized membrane protein
MKKSATTPDTIEIPLRRLLAIATQERGLMICVFGVVILSTLLFYVSSMIQAGPQRPAELLTYTVPFVGFFMLVSLAATWIATLALLSKVNERMDFMTGLLVAVLMLTPLLHIVFLPSPIAFIWAIDRAARTKLKANGVMVGMMGADLGTLRKRLAEQELDEEDITPSLAEQPS